jgi:hypothetical protein
MALQASAFVKRDGKWERVIVTLPEELPAQDAAMAAFREAGYLPDTLLNLFIGPAMESWNGAVPTCAPCERGEPAGPRHALLCKMNPALDAEGDA